MPEWMISLAEDSSMLETISSRNIYTLTPSSFLHDRPKIAIIFKLNRSYAMSHRLPEMNKTHVWSLWYQKQKGKP